MGVLFRCGALSPRVAFFSAGLGTDFSETATRSVRLTHCATRTACTHWFRNLGTDVWTCGLPVSNSVRAAVLRYLACWWESGGSGMSSFNPRNHGTLSFRRKERPCLSSSFLDVDPSRAPLVRVESSGTLSNRVSWEVRSGRFALDAKLNKPPPRATQRVWTSEHCPRAAPEHVNSLSQDHPRFPYHARTGRFTDAGRPGDTILPGPKHFIAERTSGTAELGKSAACHACTSPPDLRSCGS